jgi:hypothetical protein
MPPPDVGLGRDVGEWSVVSDYHKFFATFDVNAVLIKSGRYGKKFLIIDRVFSLSLV